MADFEIGSPAAAGGDFDGGPRDGEGGDAEEAGEKHGADVEVGGVGGDVEAAAEADGVELDGLVELGAGRGGGGLGGEAGGEGAEALEGEMQDRADDDEVHQEEEGDDEDDLGCGHERWLREVLTKRHYKSSVTRGSIRARSLPERAMTAGGGERVSEKRASGRVWVVRRERGRGALLGGDAEV